MSEKTETGSYVEECVDGSTRIFSYRTNAPTRRGELAAALVHRTGLHRDMPPTELVAAACETADRLITEMEERGWLIDVPAPRPPDEKYLRQNR